MRKELSDFVTEFADVEYDLNNVIQILEVFEEFYDSKSELELRRTLSIIRRILKSLDVELNDIIRQLDTYEINR